MSFWPYGAALAVSVLAILASATRTIAPSGVLTGSLLALVFASTGTPRVFLVFVVFVVLGTWSSRIGRDQKQRMGVLQGEGRRRNWTHALANCGPAAGFLLIGHLLFPERREVMEVVAATGLAAMLSDTAASEWGPVFGTQPRHMFTGQRVDVGTNGGVTWPGTLAALLASAIGAAIGFLRPDSGAEATLLILIFGFLGNLFDSALGATLEPFLGRHGGAWVNAMASSLAMVSAFTWVWNSL